MTKKQVLFTIIMIGAIWGVSFVKFFYFRYRNALAPGDDPILVLPLTDFANCDAIQGYGQITPEFYHNGIDFGVNATTIIVASHAAYVIDIRCWFNDKGGHWQTNVRLWLNSQWLIEIAFESWALNETFGMLQRDAIIIEKGQHVAANETLGLLLSHGPHAHIHFGIYSNNQDQCPYTLFSATDKAAFEVHFYLVNYTTSWCM